jgi:hypothetical protein
VTDVPAIEKLWADDFTVNAPNNKVLMGKPDAIKLVRDGILDYSSFERDVEAVLIHGDTAPGPSPLRRQALRITKMRGMAMHRHASACSSTPA